MNGLRRYAVAGAATLDNVWHGLKRLEGSLGRTPVFTASRLVAAHTTVVDSDDLLLVTTAGGAVTVTLPPAADYLGRRFTVKKTNAAGASVTLDGDGSETIDGAATLAWSTQYQSYTVQAVVVTAPATVGWVIV